MKRTDIVKPTTYAGKRTAIRFTFAPKLRRAKSQDASERRYGVAPPKPPIFAETIEENFASMATLL